MPLIEDMRSYGRRWLGASGDCTPASADDASAARRARPARRGVARSPQRLASPGAGSVARFPVPKERCMPVAHRLSDPSAVSRSRSLALFVALGGTSYAATTTAATSATASGGATRVYAASRASADAALTTKAARAAGQRKVSWAVARGRGAARAADAGRPGRAARRGRPGRPARRGAVGPQGASGPAGAQGPVGAQGRQAAAGPQGPVGAVDQATLDAIDARLDTLEAANARLATQVGDLQADNARLVTAGRRARSRQRRDWAPRVEALETRFAGVTRSGRHADGSAA